MNKKRVTTLVLIILPILILGYFLFLGKSLVKDSKELININKLSKRFMNNYFDKYKNLDDDDKKNMLIVISSKKISAKDFGAEGIIEGPNHKYYLLFKDETTKKNAKAKLDGIAYVNSVDENHMREAFTNDSGEYNSWGIASTGLDHAKQLISGIDANEVVVAILDTGCDTQLFNKYYSGRLAGTYSVIDGDDSMYDSFGHGTHIAGTIAEGTPDNVKIYPIKISDSRGMYDTDIVTGIEYVTYYNIASVMNMSFGGPIYNDAQYQAIEAAKMNNIISVAAAGNENTSAPSYPAAYDNTISISSVDENLSRSFFSNYGEKVTFAAPGGMINSIMASYMELSSNQDNDPDHETISGTSMATPHAVAAVAVLKSIDTSLNFDDVVDVLKENADDLGPSGYDYYYGYGLINFKGVVLCTTGDTSCDDHNIFKVNLPVAMDIPSVSLTEYNYGSYVNLLENTVYFEEVDGNDFQSKLKDLEDVVIDGYDPYSNSLQTVTVRYKGLETTLQVQNPPNYESGWEYYLDGGNYYINGYKDSNIGFREIVIPDKIYDKNIKGIKREGFINSSIFAGTATQYSLKKLIFSEGIEYVGDLAFFGLPTIDKVVVKGPSVTVGKSSFEGVTFLSSIQGNIKLTSDSNNAFKNDIFLETINLSNDTLVIPSGSFEGCETFEGLTIPNSVQVIETNAFFNAGLNTLNIPNSVTTIDNYAFAYNNLESIEIPESVNNLGKAPFKGNHLTSIVVDSNNTKYDSRDNSNLIIETETNKTVQGSYASVIPDSVTTIGEESYSGFDHVLNSSGPAWYDLSNAFTTLNIPEGVTTIEPNAFLDSDCLAKVVLPNSINMIDSTVFAEGTSGSMSAIQRTVLWVHDNSYSLDYAIDSNSTYVIIEDSSNALDIGGFFISAELERIYYAFEQIEVTGFGYDYWNESSEEWVSDEITNYTVKYQNGDSFRYGDNKFYTVFDLGSYHNIQIGWFVNVVPAIPEFSAPTIELLRGESLLNKLQRDEQGFPALRLENGYLYYNNAESYSEAGDYTVKGYYVPDDNINYSIIWDVDLPIHVVDKKAIQQMAIIPNKVYDGTTNIDLDSIRLYDQIEFNDELDRSQYEILSAQLNSPDVDDYATVTIRVRLNDDTYQHYGFYNDKQEAEWEELVSVIKANPTYEVPTNITATVGQELKEISLPPGFEWMNKNQTINQAGNITYKARYVPSDTNNYNIIENIDIIVKVESNIDYVLNAYKLDNTGTIIYKIPIGTTRDIFMSKFTLGTNYSLIVDFLTKFDINLIYTGGVTRVLKNNQTYREFINAVMGDINGDGFINSADLLKIRQHLLNYNILQGAYFYATDVDYDGKITSADLLRMRQHLLDIRPIE